MIVRVTLEIALRQEFDYLVPEALEDQVEIGTRVKVPFGHREVMGCVTAIVETSEHKNLRPISRIIGTQSLVTPKVLRIARWIAEYYCCAPETALKSVLPEAVRREKDGWKEQLHVTPLTPPEPAAKLTKRQQEIVDLLRQRGEMRLQQFAELAETTAETVRRLEDKGYLRIAQKTMERDPYANEQIVATQQLVLSAEQKVALDEIVGALGGAGLRPALSGVPPESVERPKSEAMVPTQPGFPPSREAEATVSPKHPLRTEAVIRSGPEARNSRPEACATQSSRSITGPTARQRRLPHFEIPGKIYHITWRTRPTVVLSQEARAAALEACHFWHAKSLRCFIACVMPDHVHLLIQPLPIKDSWSEVHSLTELLHSIKSFSAHAANKAMNRTGALWEVESFDRMIRSEADLHQKWNYIWNNPREAGLVGPTDDYPFIWTPEGGAGLRPALSGVPPESVERPGAETTVPGQPEVTQSREAGAAVSPKPLLPSEAAIRSGPEARNSRPEACATRPNTFLLHGVTGSGKTEVYLQAIARTLEMGKGAIVLVPEISLTPQTVERFKARFSSGSHQTQVAVLHSHLSAGERHDEWHKIRKGRARIVIGARSAIFAPVDPLGLIIVDEEHEHSYKQEEAPRYNARDVAVVRGLAEDAVVVLGSATPSLESYHNAKKGKYRLLELPHRADNAKMPIVRIVDMRQTAKKQKDQTVLSPQLKEAILQRLEKKEQVMLFLNRRGYATSLQCPQCGYIAQCPNCSVSLTYHRAEQKLCCHICRHEAAAPTVCPEKSCRNPAIRFAGLGTEKVESTLTRLFPHARISRMDSDTLKRKDDFRRILGDFRTGKIDILVGTQMIAKGLHFPNVTLVGIIHADLGLHIPDFRAGERTFQLLTQVAGRAGRGDVEGEVWVQAFTPFHPSIQYARRHDFLGFYEQEIEFREQLRYPPFSRIALLTFRGRNEEKAEFTANHFRKELDALVKDFPDLTISGPAPAPLAKAEKNFRFQIMLRVGQMSRLSKRMNDFIQKSQLPDDVLMSIDVDPVNLQ